MLENLDLIHLVFLFVVGAVAGFIDAIVGGGGMLTLPSLLACGLPPHAALATNKILACFGSTTAMARFARLGMIDFSVVGVGMACAALGSVGGTLAMLAISPRALNYIIPALLIGVFLYTIFSPKLGDEERVARMNSAVFFIIFGFIIGFYDGFFGPATGSLWIFALVALQGYGLKHASAATKATNCASNLASGLVWAASGQVVWVVGVLMGVGQIIGAWLGANAVVSHSVAFVRRLFLLVVFASIAKLVWGWF